VTGVSDGLCGASRPGHFDGVATVVCKLFHQALPDMAFFGEKDFQQLAVIRAMARDLDLTRPHVRSIIGVPTVREADGLAMSSRNRYLSDANRAAAATLPRAMQDAIARIEDGQETAPTLNAFEDELLGAGFDSIDYVSLVDSSSLAPISTLTGSAARLIVAARIGGTRLIDNMAVSA
jgi:pantoate--beta-alanine ligase